MRYDRIFGLDAEQLDELEARIEDILPDPWDKETGRPKSLSLREAIMVTLRSASGRISSKKLLPDPSGFPRALYRRSSQNSPR